MLRRVREGLACPECDRPLTGLVRYDHDPRLITAVHVYGGFWIRQYSVAELLGECQAHGLVRTRSVLTERSEDGDFSSAPP